MKRLVRYLVPGMAAMVTLMLAPGPSAAKPPARPPTREDTATATVTTWS